MGKALKVGTSEQSAELAAVAGHPLRARAWLILMQRVASPKQIADELGVHVRDVTYHVKVLLEAGIVEPAGEEPVRGAVRHLYRSCQRLYLDKEGTEALTEDQAVANGVHVLQLIFADAAIAVDAGTLVRRRDHHLARNTMVLDQEGWEELNASAAEYLDRTFEIEAAAAARLAESGAEEIAATTSVIVHETPDTKYHRSGI